MPYTTDGTTWVDVNGDIYDNYQEHVVVEGLELENVVGVRYICTTAGNKWPSMREFRVITESGDDTGYAYTNVDAYKEVTASYGEDTNTLESLEVTLAKGEYIGLKLDRIHELNDIKIKDQSVKDIILSECYDIEISMNGVEWESVLGQDVYGKDARYIRLIKVDDCEGAMSVEGFVVTTNEIYGKSMTDTNYTSFEGDVLALFTVCTYSFEGIQIDFCTKIKCHEFTDIL